MIIELPDTTVSKIAKALIEVREEGGVTALGRVLTLIIVTKHGAEDEVIEAANDASREHPMRVIVLTYDAKDSTHATPRLDAEIRVGGDAGASEVIVLRAVGAAGNNSESLVTGLLLPDAPVVAWWPHETPLAPSRSSIGRIAQRRITDAAAQPNPAEWVADLSKHYAPGDTDLAWTRLTRWREQLAAVLDQPPFEPVDRVEVHGAGDSPSTALLAAWLRLTLDAPVEWTYADPSAWSHGIKSVRLVRASGDTLLERPEQGFAILSQPGQPTHELAFARRTLRECIAEELRSLDADLLYGRVISEGWAKLTDEPAEATA
ncbi:OpcA protein [Microbacterium mangrovi]|uniref:OpcA protein n=1 Tax=Microbacterium mangrovi TaxID=1348253 RepID=A0A0B2A5N6_9MICO|nr:glucose-6-phosphate dehydrogenase assembly protein OpcA [Microbacterium mangrovi]KHK96873.1 OpcA protein [Microbacterium mangrovi]